MREDKLKEFMDKLAEERQKRRAEERLKLLKKMNSHQKMNYNVQLKIYLN